jgi:hypothetical protein
VSDETKKPATELEWLNWFYCNCDFGPAHEDVLIGMKERFEKRTGKLVPDGYRYGLDGEDE